MAQRQYDMKFILDAKTGSQYSSTFKQAQAELRQFHEGYRALSSSLNDISGYQRQQSAVENTGAKLAMLKEQEASIQREFDSTGQKSSDLETKLIAKKAAIEKTTKAYEEQKARLDEYKRRLEEAGVDTSALQKESERLKQELEKLRTGFKESADESENFGERGSDALQNISGMLAAAGITKALKEIYEAFSACVEVSADFEASMSNVEAISGANGEQIGALTERAKELGATTAFTAQQVSEGMSYMAMAGWDTNSMLAGMDSVLALAAASGEDLGTVSDIVTDALTAFGLKASDTGRFADVLAAAATNANTNVGMMGETFKYAAPVAGALGYSVEDVAVAVGLMANSGIKASQAGTTLRNIFNGLLGGVDLTSEAFGELEVSFVNTDGTMMDLASSMSTLRSYFEQMTEAERVQNAVNIAGQRGYSGLLAILNSTTEDYDKLTDAINNSSGAAQKMADIKLDNLRGQMTIAKSAFEGLKIAVGEQFQPTLTKLYGSLADVTGKFTEFVKEHPAAVKVLAALTIGLGTVAAGLAAYTAAAVAAKVATEAMKGPIGWLELGVTALAVSLGVLMYSADTAEDALRDTRNAVREAQMAVEDANAQIETAEKDTTAAAMTAEVYIDRLKELEEAGTATGEAQAEYQATVEELNRLIPGLNAQIDEQTGLVQGGTDALLENTNAWKQNAITQAVMEANSEKIKAWAQLQLQVGETEKQRNEIEREGIRISEEIEKKEQAIADAQRLRNQLTEESCDSAEEFFQKQSEYDDLIGKLQNDVSQLTQDQERNRSELDAANMAYDEGFATMEQYEQEIQQAKDSLAEFDEASQDVADSVAASTNSAEIAISSYREEIQRLDDAYAESYAAAKDSIEGQYQIWDEVAEVSATSVDSVIGNLEKQKEYWNSYNDNIQTVLSYSGEIEGLSDMVAEFGDGSAESVNMIAGMAAAAEAGDASKIQEMVTAWQDNKTAQDEAAQSLGDLVSGYSAGMDEIGQEIAQAVQDMDKTSESYAAAQSTIQGFIDGANAMLPSVQAAYARIGQAAANALRANQPSMPTGRGYASGTDNATPGWHRVGENGPETIWFNGGEVVWNARETSEFMKAMEAEPVAATSGSYGDAYVHLTYAPQYNLSGVSDTAEIRAMLAEYDEEMKRQIREMLAEESENAARRAYV